MTTVTLLAAGTTAVTSSDFTVASGQPVRVAMTVTSTTARMTVHSVVAGVESLYAMLTQSDPGITISAPGTYRVKRPVLTVASGVEVSTLVENHVEAAVGALTGATAGIADPLGATALDIGGWKNNIRKTPIRRYRNLLALNNAAPWDDRSGSGLAVTVDSTVLFDGQPTLRLDIPASSSGTYRVGTTAASVAMPYSWDGKGLTVAVMTNNAAAVAGLSSVFLGDAAFTNFNAHGGLINPANVPQANWVANEWMVARAEVLTPTGSPTLPGVKRLRINFNVTSNASTTSVWIGFIGIVAPKKTTVVLSIDDGYRTGYDFVAPLSRYYNLPVSFGIDRYYVEQQNPTYFTKAHIQELHADNSDLFEFVTHGYNNTNLTTAGSAADYVQQQVDTRAYLRTLGVLGDGPNHHPWVQSIYDNTATAAMKAAGFLSARVGAAGTKSTWDSHYPSGQDKQAFIQVAAISPTSGLTVANLQTAVNAAVTEGYGITHVNMHQAGAVDAASPLTWSYDKWIDAFGWLAAQRDAGALDVQCWGRAYANAVGVGYKK